VAGVFVPIVIALALAALSCGSTSGATRDSLCDDRARHLADHRLSLRAGPRDADGDPRRYTGKAAEYGILIRSGEALERLAKAKTVLLDKNGHDHRGKPTVTQHHDRQAARRNADHVTPTCSVGGCRRAALQHPLAQAILKAANDKQVGILSVEKFAAMEGSAVRGEPSIGASHPG